MGTTQTRCETHRNKILAKFWRRVKFPAQGHI